MLNELEVIGHYRIVRHLNRGMFANAYEAVHIPAERRVFLKEYISPRPSKPWYKPFVAHQRALAKVLGASGASQFCLLPQETFESSSRVTASGESRKTPPTLYQAFEFIDSGIDLEKRLAKKMSWEDRRMFASVLAFGLKELHGAGVIHTDLKPANLQVVEKSGPAGRVIRTPRLIDLDFAILARKKAPWDGHNGYVGTPGYMSPEHLGGPGSVPLTASDVFTAGIILHELLGSGNPLHGLDDGQYLDAIKSGRLKPLMLAGTFGRPEHDAKVIDAVSACLAFDPRDRPSAQDLHRSIVGADLSDSVPPPPRTSPPPPPPPSRSTETSSRPVPPESPPGKPATAGIRLSGGTSPIDIRVTTTIGRSLLLRCGPDARFAATEQYRIIRENDAWYVEHMAATGNQTIVNGKRLTERIRLSPGDRISVGNADRGIEKVTLQVELLR